MGQLLDFEIFSFFWFLGFYFVCALTCIPWGGFWLDDYPPPPLPPSFFTESAHALGLIRSSSRNVRPYVCRILSPSHAICFRPLIGPQASDHKISLRPLIGQPSFTTKLSMGWGYFFVVA